MSPIFLSFRTDALKTDNADGTISVTGVKKLITRKDGSLGWSRNKTPNIHTVAPESWTNTKILDAGHQTSSIPGVVLRDSNGVKTTIHTSVVDGVQWQVLKDNGVVTSSFPTGGNPIVP